MPKRKIQTVAAIDVGSNSIRMIIAQISRDGLITILEDLHKPTHIGKDTFSYGRIQVESIHHTCDTLKGFVKLMQDYKAKHYRAVTTSGIREAGNREYVLEQIRLRTGLDVEIINNAQERFLMYKAVREYFPDIQRIHDEGLMILDIGSGGVEVTVYGEGNLRLTEYVKVGSLRLREILADLERLTLDFPSIMEEFIESRVGFLKKQVQEKNIKNFIGLGGELRTINKLCMHESGGAEEKLLKKEVLAKLYAKVHTMTTEQIIQEYGIQRNQAEILLPSIIIFYRFLLMTDADGIYAPMLSLRHGMLADMADELYDTPRKKESLKDIIDSVWYVGHKYSIDKVHSEHITRLALSIFDQTQKIHGMDEQDRFYLQVACILHDIGKLVNLNQHDLHSYNIIRFQGIIGFSNREIDLVANVARYHSEENPSLSHENYLVLGESGRIKISKMAAILKLAEAMDISHKQKINKIEASITGSELQLIVRPKQDILLEEWNFANNAGFFEEVMGLKTVIKRRR